jgi:hypothetical protein
MVTIGIFGTLSVGKNLFIEYCTKNYDFSLIDLSKLEGQQSVNNESELEGKTIFEANFKSRIFRN